MLPDGDRLPYKMGAIEAIEFIGRGGFVDFRDMEGRLVHIIWENGKPLVEGWL